MKKLLSLFFLVCSIAGAQTTAVTATITDSDSTVWASATYSVTFVPNPSFPNLNQYSIGGVPITNAEYVAYLNQSGTTNSSGALSLTLLDNTQILPTGSSWRFSIQPNASVASTVYAPVSVSGSSYSLTSFLSSNAIAPRFAALPGSFGYADIEVSTTPVPGAAYFNTTSSISRQWYSGAWHDFSGGGGGTVAANEFVLSGAGSQNFTTNLNSLYPMWSCITKSGAQWGPASVAPVDANDVSFTSAGATDTVCNFSAGGVLNPNFAFTVTPNTLTYYPTMGGTQTPTFAIAQTGTGGYSGTATYSCTSLASGMSCDYSPATITGSGASTLSLSFPATQPAATTNFNASATDGTNTHTQPVAITIAGTNTNLIEGWPIDEATGLTYFDAVSTNNFTAQNIAWDTVAGFPGKMAEYSGAANSNATAANQTLTNFTGTTPFSVSFWAVDTTGACTEDSQVTTLDPANSFIGWEVGSGCNGSSQAIAFFFLVNAYPANAINVQNVATTNLRDGTLHHVCVSYTGGQKAADVSFYLDGVLQTNATPTEDTLSSSAANTKPITLGSRSDGTVPMIGGVGFLRLYSSAIGSECTTLYAAGPK